VTAFIYPKLNNVANGVTDAQVQANNDTIRSGGTPVSDPVALNSPPTPGTGSDALSPGSFNLLSHSLPTVTCRLH
jgi:hypothetical protein